VGTFGFRLIGNQVANTVDQVFVESCPDSSATWKASGRCASVEVCSTDTIGAIRSAD
jgi:hypothetical protein